MTTQMYDIAIVGMGFAGYSGAIYATRDALKTVVIGEIFGGQTAEAHLIGNYPGFEEITGIELMQKVQSQAVHLGAEEVYERVEKVVKNGEESFTLALRNGEAIQARSVLITTGMTPRKLDAPGEKELFGKGISYCATCDGFFFKGKDVAVVGGGDAGVTAALYLSEICPTIHLIVRGDHLKGEQYWIDKVKANPAIKVHFNTTVNKFEGKDSLERILLNDGTTSLDVVGAFIQIGHIPNKAFTDAVGIQTDESGYIVVTKEQETTIPGIFAAGDATNASNKFAQLLTAGAEAAVAVDVISRRLAK